MTSKEEIRQFVWNQLEDQGAAAFPFPPTGRIPNFVGSSRAADQITRLDEWEEVTVIKANPDSPQRYIRKLALEHGKVVYMAVPRLKDEQCFVRIEVAADQARSAASISGAFDYGTPMHPADMEEIDLIVTGCVAVNEQGQRIGKGEGYSDLELAILAEFERIQSGIPIISTVHPLQIIEQQFEQQKHDLVLSTIMTEDRVIHTNNHMELPQLQWANLSQEKIAAIPILQELQP